MNDVLAQSEPATAGPATKSPALWKQLMGAGAGALVALGMYGAYMRGGDQIAAFLTPPGWREAAPDPQSTREVQRDAFDDEMERIAKQAAGLAALTGGSSSTAAMTAASSLSAPQSSTMSDVGSAISAITHSVSSAQSTLSSSRWSTPKEEGPRSTALPDTGFPVVGVIGAAMGTAIMRFKRR